MRGAVLGRELQCLVEVLDGTLGILQIVVDVAAIHPGFHHLGIAFERARVIINRLAQQLRLFVHVSGEQREVRLFRQDLLILAGEREHVVISPEVVKRVSKIDGCVAVLGKLL